MDNLGLTAVVHHAGADPPGYDLPQAPRKMKYTAPTMHKPAQR
jgi:hypothetical protein